MKTTMLTITFCTLFAAGYGQNSNNSNDPCNGLVAEFHTTVHLPAGGIQFSDASQFNNQTLTYYWDFGNGKSSTGEDPFMVFDEGTYQVSLTVKDVNGCEKTYAKEVVFSYGGQ